jgi:hypothetical protein
MGGNGDHRGAVSEGTASKLAAPATDVHKVLQFCIRIRFPMSSMLHSTSACAWPYCTAATPVAVLNVMWQTRQTASLARYYCMRVVPRGRAQLSRPVLAQPT